MRAASPPPVRLHCKAAHFLEHQTRTRVIYTPIHKTWLDRLSWNNSSMTFRVSRWILLLWQKHESKWPNWESRQTLSWVNQTLSNFRPPSPISSRRQMVCSEVLTAVTCTEGKEERWERQGLWPTHARVCYRYSLSYFRCRDGTGKSMILTIGDDLLNASNSHILFMCALWT